jgi:hypothetical protein
MNNLVLEKRYPLTDLHITSMMKDYRHSVIKDVPGISCNLAKAFDSVTRRISTTRLSYGIDGIASK